MNIEKGAVRSAPVEARLDKGRHWRAKLGFVVLAMEQTVEDDVFALTPPGVGVHFARIPMSNHATVETLGAMESDIGKPAVVSNQAMMWDCLRLAGIEDVIPGYGSLLELDCAAHRSVLARESRAPRAA